MKKIIAAGAFCIALFTFYPSEIKAATNSSFNTLDNPGKHKHHRVKAHKSKRGDRVVRAYHQPYGKTHRVTNRISMILQ